MVVTMPLLVVALLQGPSDSVSGSRDTVAANPGLPIPVSAFFSRFGPPADSASRTLLQEPRKRTASVEYSDFYAVRLKIHKILSFTMLPLFAGSYITGDQLFKKSNAAPAWARNTHGAFATGTAVLFTANTITGLWNLWDSRKDPAGRTKRYLHAVMFMAASAGFTYAGVKLAEDAEESADKRRLHRTVALSSMGLSIVSWSIMLF